MSDESFFREVNEEIRQDRTRRIWARYGRLIMAVAVAAVLVTVGYVAWREYSISQANQSGDNYLAALDLASTGKPDEALSALDAMAENGYGAYRDLARMRAATLKEKQGARADAVAAFDAVAADSSAPSPIRDMAAIRAAYILVDTGSLDDVSQRVVQLSGEDRPLRYPAREALGLAAWKAGDNDDARRYFEQLRDDQGTPSGIAIRARLLLELIDAGSRPVAVDVAATPPAPPAVSESAVPAAPSAPSLPAADEPAAPSEDAPAPATDAAPPASEPAAPASPAPEQSVPADPAASGVAPKN